MATSPTALLALNATVGLHGGYSAREMPLAELLAQTRARRARRRSSR